MQQDPVMTDQYTDHLRELERRWQASLDEAGYDAAVIAAGEPRNYFLDDQAPPVRLNPHFLQWCPAQTAVGSVLLVRPGERPHLYFLQPDDYWHQPPEVPSWTDAFDVSTFAERSTLLETVASEARRAGNRVAFVGESGLDVLESFAGEDENPSTLLNPLHFSRAVKTDFELACMRAATDRAVRGHLAARSAFFEGASEFQINTAYLAASEQLTEELPYSSIVALNEHAGTLHYQHYDRRAPGARRSFLIDAGGGFRGYAADITRTYAADQTSLFADLVTRLDAAQQQLVDRIVAGTSFLDLHVTAHRHLAGILCDTGVLRGPADAAFEAGLTEAFLPHGLGHLIGLQTHDVGGQQRAPQGGTTPPPENYPTLRLTRTLDERIPVTIEPGLYFIPQLLDAVRAGPHAALVDWEKVAALAPYGGIRIEDNVVILDGSVENLTRDAFARLSPDA